ncbi:MAG: antitoxin component YwqK of YwqJK toxin-antitoxin module [Bacteroidia bacterium]|jgi:antitoxin component YwqK of YwqJK toxin-antitoxin module
MKTLKSIFLLLIASQTVFAQDTTTLYFDQSWDEIPTERGAKYYRQQFQTNDTTFIVRDYFMSGQLQMTGSYSDDTYQIKHGYFEYFHDNGEKSLTCTYNDGSYEGAYYQYYTDGNIRLESTYVDNELAGPYKRYFENGKLKTDMFYTNGKAEGEAKYYHETGELSSEGVFKEDLRINEWKFYDENGEYLASEWRVQKIKLPCGSRLTFEGDHWIHTDHDDHGKVKKNYTDDNFYRRGVYDSKGNEMVVMATVSCLTEVKGARDWSLDLLAINYIKGTKGKKASKVDHIGEHKIDLDGGVLYQFYRKDNGRKYVVYMYVNSGPNTLFQVFIKAEKGVDAVLNEEFANILNNAKW